MGKCQLSFNLKQWMFEVDPAPWHVKHCFCTPESWLHSTALEIFHQICLKYHRFFFLMCKFSAEFPRMGFRKSWILMELKTCTRRTAYGNMLDTLWFNNTAINSICIIVLLVINIWMWTCTQCIIFWVKSPTSEVACLTWFDDVSASHGYLHVCSYFQIQFF